MKNIYSNRVKKALKLLSNSTETQALVISSNPLAVRSRDTNFPYRQNSDLFYFTGSFHDQITLVLRPHAKEKVIIVCPPKDPVKKVWEGASPSINPTAKSIGATVLTSKDPSASVVALLRGSEAVYLPTVIGGIGADVRRYLNLRSSHTNRGLPSHIIEAERLTAKLRCIKDGDEIEAIQRAADLTSATLLHINQYIKQGIKEREIAALIDYLYRLHGAEPAFNSIVACGISAATLHYRALSRTLKNGELLLIDTGCELDMYACDVSRTIPIGDRVPTQLVDLYEVVLSAQRIAISKVRPGIHIDDVYKAAVAELTQGLKAIGVLRGNTSKLISQGAFKPYFPHGIGHSLGIDVHDVGPENGDKLGELEPGMVITIEPGLYFSKPQGRIPACGIRIEDDVVVTTSKGEILTEDVFPKDLEEIRNLVS